MERVSAEDLTPLLKEIQAKQRRGLVSTIASLGVAAAVAGLIVWISYSTVRSNLAEVTALRQEILQAREQLETVQAERGAALQELANARQALAQAQQEAQTARREAATLRDMVAGLTRQVQDLERRLRASTEITRFVHPIDWTEAKILASRYPSAQGLLLLLADPATRQIPWRLRGASPREGFDSPGFAAFALCQTGVLREYLPFRSIDAMRRRFEPTASPRVGDLALFEGGFTMFLLRDARNQDFVVGMTPFGIAALEPGFARLLGFLRVSPPPARLVPCR